MAKNQNDDRQHYTKDGRKVAIGGDAGKPEVETAVRSYWLDKLRKQREAAAKSGSTGERGFAMDLAVRGMEAAGAAPETIDRLTKPGDAYKKAHPDAENVVYKAPDKVDPDLEKAWGKHLDDEERQKKKPAKKTSGDKSGTIMRRPASSIVD